MKIGKAFVVRGGALAVLSFALLFGGARPAEAVGVSLTVTPSGGVTSGPAGTVIGFSYIITNSTSDYYQPTGLNAGLFSGDTGNAIFDYPEVAPNTTVTENFTQTVSGACPTPDCGFYEITLGGLVGNVNSGTFSLSGEFYADGSEIHDLGAAPTLTANYSVTTTSPTTVTPEPSAAVLGAVAGLVLLSLAALRKLLCQA